MSFDKALRQMIQEEIRSVVGPLAEAIGELQQNDVASQLSALLGGGAVKRGPGRPRKFALLGRAPAARTAAAKGGAARSARGSSDRACAILGCKRPARSKGYCAAHYQKMRNLVKTKRLPSDWKDNADPGTVKDMVLPRGRAGAKALADSRKQ